MWKKLDFIAEDSWKQYKELWCGRNETENGKIEDYHNDVVDPITLDELQALKNSKNRKACSLDGIDVKMLKYGGHLFELRFLHLINECWKKCDIPSAWHTAKVISLFKKKGERTKCENYRGISLLNSAYKVYSRIINQQLKTMY
jgi:hypothetical protein